MFFSWLYQTKLPAYFKCLLGEAYSNNTCVDNSPWLLINMKSDIFITSIEVSI